MKWLLITGVLIVGLVAAVNWQAIVIGVAMVFNDTRPELLNDADWGNPGSAKSFNRRFAIGTSESGLIVWLRANDFAIDRHSGHAERRIEALPCNELIRVSWDATSSGVLKVASATVTEAGCL